MKSGRPRPAPLDDTVSPGPAGPASILRSARSRLGRMALAVLLCLLAGTVWASEICASELRAAIVPDAAPARVATALVRTAVEAIEPAMPAVRGASRQWEDANAHWLDRRGFLPRQWDEDGGLTSANWASLLAKLQEPYRVSPRRLSGATDPQTLLEETQRALEAVVESLRPLALLATVPGERDELAFAGVTWNWTPKPRFLLFDPRGLDFGPDGEVDSILASLGTCAWQPRSYLSTNARTATNFYLGSDSARARLLATDRADYSELVPVGQEMEFLSFEAEALAGAHVAAIGFEGPGPSFGQVAGLLLRAESNIGAFDLMYYMTLP
ncbi:MAG TPA: hypothetical protein VF168_11920 [Trueperaceae bacterium]